MNNLNKVYTVQVLEYSGNIKSENSFCVLNRILSSNISYSLEDALSIGKQEIRDYFYNIIYKNSDVDEIPDDITDEQLETSIKTNLDKNISYSILISIVSGNRIRFNTSKELMNYFNTNIKNISIKIIYMISYYH